MWNRVGNEEYFSVSKAAPQELIGFPHDMSTITFSVQTSDAPFLLGPVTNCKRF